MNLNDLESIPAFLVAGLLFVLTNPPLLQIWVMLLSWFRISVMAWFWE